MKEITCKQVGTLTGGKWDKVLECTRRVYSTEYIAPTITTCGGGNQEVKILEEPLAYDEQNGYIRSDGTVGTIMTDGSSPKHNSRVVEPTIYDGFNQRVRADNTVNGTITRNVGYIADLKRNGQGVIEPVTTSGHDVACTIRASIHKQGKRNLAENIKSGRGYEGIIEPHIRVRKLTERECGKLMGVKPVDCAKIATNLSKSAQYHCYGDSIVTPVLMAIFGELLGIDWQKKVKETVEEIVE